jgi:hypothetical protein
MAAALAQAGLNLFVAACLGASIGLERQWRQHLAGFYRKLGYHVFGELDSPPGHQRIFLQKRLAGGREARAVGHPCAVLRATQRFQPVRFIFL